MTIMNEVFGDVTIISLTWFMTASLPSLDPGRTCFLSQSNKQIEMEWVVAGGWF